MDGRRKERRKGVREGEKKPKGLATCKQKWVDIDLYKLKASQGCIVQPCLRNKTKQKTPNTKPKGPEI